jgi:hypothetical protein
VETLPLFLVTLTKNIKSQAIIKLNSLNHIIIKIKLHRAEIGLTQSYNCQNVGHVWANYKQPPRCLCCGGSHLHRKCPEKTITESKPSCCSCALLEGNKPHPASYRGCSDAKGDRKGEEQNELPRDPLGVRSSLNSLHQSSSTQLHCVQTLNTGNHGHFLYEWVVGYLRTLHPVRASMEITQFVREDNGVR